jgi:hypothetical protein
MEFSKSSNHFFLCSNGVKPRLQFLEAKLKRLEEGMQEFDPRFQHSATGL